MTLDVRHRRGHPIDSDFSSSEGTPIVVDTDNGRAYIMDSNNQIKWINRRMEVYSGTGVPPPSLGDEGDLFISDSGWWYEKEAGVWNQISNSIGPVGPQGPTGATGPAGPTGATGAAGSAGLAGSQIYTGVGIPSPSLGVSGDVYIETVTCDLYHRGVSWGSPVGNIKGLQGIQGIQGVPGIPGTLVDVESTSGTSATVNTTSGQEIMVLAIGDWVPGLLLQTVSLNFNGIPRDAKGVLTGLLSGRVSFSMAFVDIPGAGSHTITVTATGGTLANVKIIVTKVG